jgi:hypothetical protein
VAETLTPSLQGLQACTAVVELTMMRTMAHPQQAGIELGFGDVETEAHGRGGLGGGDGRLRS